MKGVRDLILSLLGLLLCIHLCAQESVASLEKEAFEALESNSGKAERLANELLKATQKNDTSLYTVNAYTILGIVNKNKGFYLSALNFYLKALEIAENIKDEGRISAILNNIGVLYQLQDNYKVALKYFNRSLHLEEKLGNPLQKSIRYFNIGDCYKELHSYDLALSHYNSSLLIEEKYKNKEGILFSYLGIAEVYIAIKQYSDAKRMLEKANTFLTVKYLEPEILYHKLKGIFYLETKKMNAVISSLEKAKSLSIKNNFPIHLLDIFQVEIRYYDAVGNWKNLAETYKKYTKLSEEQNAIEVKNKIQDLTFRHDLQKKELEIKLIQEERDFAKKLNRFNSKITLFLILVLLFIVGFVVYQIQSRKK